MSHTFVRERNYQKEISEVKHVKLQSKFSVCCFLLRCRGF